MGSTTEDAETRYDVEIRATPASSNPSWDGEREPLAVGSVVEAWVRDTDGAEVAYVSVRVTDEIRLEDPEILASVALAEAGWEVPECGPEWWLERGDLVTTGRAVRLSA
jgi:hypothetical protein